MTNRVVASHSIARRAFLAAAVFALVAAGWAVVVLVGGGSWWGPLHAFLAGTVLLAISGASQMFTITWAAAPPPPARLTSTQRWLLACGAAAVLAGVTATVEPLVWAGAAAIVLSLGALSVSIVGAVRKSLLRRFDLSARFYLAAFACGAVGMTLGAVLGTGSAGSGFDRLRLVHSHLNLVGLVGFTIIGTIPTFMPTVAHHRAVSGREALVAWWLCVTGGLAMASGLVAPAWSVGAGTVLTGAAAATMVVGITVRLWSRGRHELQFLQVGMGVMWLVVWALVDGVTLIGGGSAVPFGRWTAAAVLAGVGQVLAGSLAYLLPVLLGPPLTDNLRRMTAHPWLPLAAANLGGMLVVGGWRLPAIVTLAVWIGDFARRLALVVAGSRRGGD